MRHAIATAAVLLIAGTAGAGTALAQAVPGGFADTAGAATVEAAAGRGWSSSW